jgi:GNAT superfamily N-acetyltransferase
MTAFDTAWNLVKMPLLPHSLKDKGDMKWEGVFEDPETKEHLPLHFQGSNTIDSQLLWRDLGINDLDEEDEDNWEIIEQFNRDYPIDSNDPFSRHTGETEWFGHIGDGRTIEDMRMYPLDPLLPLPSVIGEPRGHLRTDYQSPQQVHQVAVENDYRRRGYATALYDALAHILMQTQNRELYPSSDRLDEGKRFWGGKDPNRKVWPVRDDL